MEDNEIISSVFILYNNYFLVYYSHDNNLRLYIIGNMVGVVVLGMMTLRMRSLRVHVVECA